MHPGKYPHPKKHPCPDNRICNGIYCPPGQAIGNAYSFYIVGGKTMSKEELEQHGFNSSLRHVDFMIGSVEMNIDGETKDRNREPVFRNGNWAF